MAVQDRHVFWYQRDLDSRNSHAMLAAAKVETLIFGSSLAIVYAECMFNF